MPLKLPAFRRQTLPGDPVTAGPVRVTPLVRSLRFGWSHAAWTWARPSALLVEREGRTERVGVPDVTRRVQAGLLGAGAMFTLAMWAKRSRDRSESA